MVISVAVLLPFAVAAFLFAMLRPRVAILLPLVFHSLYLVRSSIGLLPTTGLELLLWSVVIGAWAGGLQSAWRARSAPLPLVSSTLVILFLLAATLSAVLSPHARTSWGIWKAMVVEPVLYALTLTWMFSRELSREGGVQKGIVPLPPTPSPLSPLIVALFLGGLVSLGASLAAGGFGVDFGRFRGVYDVPNSLALVLAPLVALSLVLAATLPRSRVRFTLWCAAGVFGSGLLATQSLAGALSVAAAVLVTGFLARRRVSLALVLPVAILAVVGFLWQAGSGKLTHLTQVSSSLAARQQIWTVVWALVGDHPLLGTGLGTFEPAYQGKLAQLLQQSRGLRSQFPVPSSQFPLEWLVRDPHNIILSLWLNAGLLGLLSMGGLWAIALGGWFRLMRQEPGAVGGGRRPSSLALGSAFLTLVLFGLVDVPYWKNDLALLWWVYLLGAL